MCVPNGKMDGSAELAAQGQAATPAAAPRNRRRVKESDMITFESKICASSRKALNARPRPKQLSAERTRLRVVTRRHDGHRLGSGRGCYIQLLEVRRAKTNRRNLFRRNRDPPLESPVRVVPHDT